MKCLILAAGYATRLYPLTENFPKPLLPVADRPILDWLMDDAHAAGGIDDFAVVTNHKFAPHFDAWAKESPFAVTVVDDGTESNETRLGAVRDLAFALEKTGWRDDVLVMAGDNLLDFSLGALFRFAAEKKTSCTMRYFEPDTEKLKKCGVAVVDENDRLLELVEKSPTPPSHWVTPPFYLYLAEDLARVPEALADGCGADAPGSLVSWLCRHSVLHSLAMPGSRFDIGNLQSYEEVRRTWKSPKS
ncbi:MAG: nucleotidyltransferase family protein [Clostridia bacterium]|nr:nucleotidyltransferase family protein [Clostridia bacterium]